MKVRKWITIGFATPLLVSLSNPKAGWAFSFTMPASEPESPCILLTSSYCSSISYTEPGVGTVVTSLKPVTELPRGGTDDFLNLLYDSVWAENGWSFERSNRDLDGIFRIGVYAPYADRDRVGAEIQVRYEPKIEEPTEISEQPEIQDPRGSSVHFIQRVVNNHALTSSVIYGTTVQPYGTLENKIDVRIEQTDPTFIDAHDIDKLTFNPFYDTYGINVRYDNGMILFEDATARLNIFDARDWYAELYLVEETAPNTVTIYNGISWGWENEFTSEEPASSETPPCDSSGGGGSGGGSGGSGCSESNWAGTNNRELPLFQEDEFDSDDFYVSNNIQQEALEFNSFNAHKIAPFTPVSTASEPIPQSIPEPGTVVGILTIGLLGIGGQLRKRK